MPRPRRALRIAAACGLLAACGRPAVENVSPVILATEELDQDQRTHRVDGRVGIADINSTLVILVDSTVLRRQVARLSGTRTISPEAIARLDVLQRVALSRLDSVARLTAALEAYAAAPAPEALARVRAASAPLARSALELVDVARADPALADRLEERLTALFEASDSAVPVPAQYEAMLRFADEVATETRRTLDREADRAGVRVQIGTWISTREGVRPVHAAGLNEVAPSDPFIVDRWVVALDDDQRGRLERAAELAAAANERGAPGLAAALAEGTGRSLRLAADQVSACVADLRGAAEALVAGNAADPPPSIARLRRELEPVRLAGDSLASLAARYREPATASGAAAFLAQADADLAAAIRRVRDVATRLPAIRRAVDAIPGELARSAELGASIEGFRSTVGACTATAVTVLEGFRAGLGGIDHAERIRAMAEETWSRMLDFQAGSVPGRSPVSLVTAGPRRPGDIFLVRVAAVTGPDSAPTRRLLDEQQVTLERVLPHLELAVGLVFADPLDSTAIQRRFQAAPSYSVLLRRGSRRSAARNRFWNLGVGLNVAATDFDKDDVPELGLGLTGSAFSDLLQAGIGYNVFLDRAYWFFGIRLPTGVVGLSGSRAPVDPSAGEDR